jgi:hypothetical protein
MNSYNISSSLNPDKVFVLQKSAIEKRLDPFYYIPELVELEKKILSRKPQRLSKFVKNIASGATPKKDETDL